ncbi:MAG: hypothetical protein HY028_09805 [Gammaproteobacteria bacterium]|nr:hypothetical protein [Gammaproteobacteria bacterium]
MIIALLLVCQQDVEKALPWAFPTHKAKSAVFALFHFSNTYSVFEKWQPIRGLHAGCFSTAC